MNDNCVVTFNPFTDRLSRDLRNDLSEGLLASLVTGDPGPFMEVATRYGQRPELGTDRSSYLAERLACYRAVLETITTEHAELDRVALLFWNHELFFELHELLEKHWMVAIGEEKLILQALIRAAGTFVLRQARRGEGARKMAARAAEALSQFRAAMPRGFEAEKLLAALADPQAPPPKFGVKAATAPCRHSGQSV